MARETDYTVLYKAAADFSALTREAAKARAILKAMREEEERANRSILQDQDRIEKARIRARKALEAQNIAATTSARISREMFERGKREAETARELARSSEAAARQITKLADAYKKLNSAASGEGTSSSAKNISDKASFAAVSARELEKVRANLAAYMGTARDTSDTNTRLRNSFKNINEGASQAGDILSRLTAHTKKQNESITEVIVSTKTYGNVVETTTRRIQNAGTEAEKVVTTIRKVTKETDGAGRGFFGWAGSLGASIRNVWREADNGTSAFSKLRKAISDSRSESGVLTIVANAAKNLGDAGTKVIAIFSYLPRVVQLAVGIATIFEPAVAVLGALGAAALGAANNIVVLGGALAAIPGFIAAAGTAAGALIVALSPVKNVLEQFKRAQLEQETQASRAARAHTDNSSALRSAASGVRNAMNSLKSAQEGVADADRRLEDAHRRLIDANKDLKKAQEDVGKAAQEAKRDLEDLREEASDGARSEERAQINLARAKERLRQVEADLNSSALDRREALLDVKEAEDELNDIRRENGRTREDLNEAEKKGISNSDRVVAANERLVKAQQSVIEAQRGVQDAQRGLAAAHRRVTDAELDLADARARLAEAGRGEASAAGAATTQQDRYNKMLEQLGPNTRKVVKDLLDLQTAWKGVQRDTGESFFSRIAGDMDKVKGLIPTVRNLLTSAAGALGDVAHKGIEMISSGPWKADFAELAKNNVDIIHNMGDAGLSVADAFRHITMAAGPFTKWVSAAIKDGASAFADWAKKAREDHSIERFLEDTKARLQQMWQITKNVLGTLKSWNTASNDFGRWVLDRLQAITGRWREVARAQEDAGSPLRRYLEDVKPLLGAIGSLLGAVARGFADMAADPENMASTIKLLQTLEKDVLPPLLRFLDQLNDSGIAITVANALGRIFEAFDKFLESGGGQAITNFVDYFAKTVSLILDLAEATHVSAALGGLVSTLAIFAGVVVAAKFVGLFKLVELFKWMISNGKKVAASFRDVGDGINSTTTTTTTTSGPRPGGGPSGPTSGPIGTVTTVGTISSDELAAVQRNVQNYSTAAEKATTKSGFFARALDGVRNSAGGMRRGLGSMVDFLGGPWGAALTVATLALTYFYAQQDKIANKAADYKSALESFGSGAGSAGKGMSTLTEETLKANPKLAEMVNQLHELGLGAGEIRDAFNGSGASVEGAIGKIDKAIEKAKLERVDFPLLGDGTDPIQNKLFNKDVNDRIEKLEALKKALREHKITNEEAARAIEALGIKEEEAGQKTEERADKTRAADFTQIAATEKAQAYGEVLNVLSDSASTTSQRFEALKRATDLLYGDQLRAIDSSDNFNRSLLELSDTLKTNGGSLSEHSLQGLNNRDALKAAAQAVRDDTLQLIASGVPYEDAIKLHNERIGKLKSEASEQVKNKDKAKELIEQYGKIPPAKETKVKLTGFDAVYQGLRELQWAQLALKYGYSPEEAAAAWKRMEAARKGQYPQGSGSAGLPPAKKASGGAVYGPGSKTSDDIEARLSNGEFVHKADAVSYYGTDLMYALNNQLIDKRTLKAAAQISSMKGGPLDFEYAGGGLIQKLASGGEVAPFPVSLNGVVAQGRKLYNAWKNDFIASQIDGGSVGTGGLRTGILGILQDLREHFGKVPLISGFREGSKTLSGNTSYHASGRAIDIAPIRAWGQYLHDVFGARLKELITPWRDLNMWNGRPHRYSKAVEAQHGVYGNNAHIHAAYASGGLVGDLNRMMSFGGLSMPSALSVPPTPMSNLSSAAKAVANGSSSSGGMNFGDIIINNPVAERGGDSIRKSVMRTAMLFDEP